MRLKNIDIKNVLCYKHFHTDFADGINVFIGRNGSGKTSLIKSVVYGLNFIMSNDKSLECDFVTSGNPDLGMRSVEINEFYRINGNEVAPDCSIVGTMEIGEHNLEWEMYKRSTAKAVPYPTKYRDAYRAFMEHSKATGRLPLLAYYSDSFPHMSAGNSQFANKEMSRGDNVLRNMGYYRWSDDADCLDLWMNRFINTALRSYKEEKTFVETDFVEQCLKSFSAPNGDEDNDDYAIKDVEVYFPGNKMMPIFKLALGNKLRLTLEELPSGYRRLYSIVFDMAYRAWMLNPQSPEETSGIVIIDEVDSHLHPALSANVMERFHKVFPHIQFIVSTHSPMIVSSLNTKNGENQIIDLSQHSERAQRVPDSYGLSYDIVVEDRMGVKSNSEEQIEFLKSVIRRANSRGKRNLAEPKEQELRSLVSEERYDQIMREIAVESE